MYRSTEGQRAEGGHEDKRTQNTQKTGKRFGSGGQKDNTHKQGHTIPRRERQRVGVVWTKKHILITQAEAHERKRNETYLV